MEEIDWKLRSNCPSMLLSLSKIMVKCFQFRLSLWITLKHFFFWGGGDVREILIYENVYEKINKHSYEIGHFIVWLRNDFLIGQYCSRGRRDWILDRSQQRACRWLFAHTTSNLYPDIRYNTVSSFMRATMLWPLPLLRKIMSFSKFYYKIGVLSN